MDILDSIVFSGIVMGKDNPAQSKGCCGRVLPVPWLSIAVLTIPLVW